MSFCKCWNLALALFTYNDILVYGQYIYLLSISIVWIHKCDRREICIWLYNCVILIVTYFQWIWNSLMYNNYYLPMFPALPYYSHSSAKAIQLLSIYNSGWCRTCWTPREHNYKQMILRLLYSWHETAQKKKQFPSPNTLTEIQPSSDNLDSNNETELTCLTHGAFLSLFIWMKGPGFSSTSPLMLFLKQWATHNICTQEHF